MGKRLEYVDIAKGIGIVLVVWSHSDVLDYMWFTGIVVPIFYFCSGFTFTQKGSFLDMLKKRFRKLFIPYLFFSLLLFCAFAQLSLREIVGVFYSRFSLYPLDVTPNVKFMTSGNYPMWFLTSMIASYFFFYILVFYKKYLLYLLPCFILATFCMTKIPILLPWSFDTALLTSLFIYAGMFVREKELITSKYWVVFVVISVYLLLQYIGGEINLSVRIYGTSIITYLVLSILGSFSLLWGARFLENTFLGKLFLSLGQHSLTIFCIQMVFIVWAKEIFKFFFPEQPLGLFSGLFEIVMALICGWGVSVLIHRNKTLCRILF